MQLAPMPSTPGWPAWTRRLQPDCRKRIPSVSSVPTRFTWRPGSRSPTGTGRHRRRSPCQQMSRWFYWHHLEDLYARCNDRFDRMMARGALDEVAALVARVLDPSLPAMKALGVPELAAHLAGNMTLKAAEEKAKQATRNFAKRQMTWFRNQIEKPDVILAQYSERNKDEIFSKICF